MSDDPIAQIRSFNRTVSQIVGALDDHYLGRDRPLGEARLLFEIGRSGADVRDLRARLALDSGYLSRLLRALERQGLVGAPVAARDRRVRRAKLTRAGRAELKEINRRSDRLARSILDPLTETQRTRLVEAMAEVERLLAAATATIDVEPPGSADAHYCLGEYFRELARRFEGGFNPAQSLPMEADELAPPRGAFLLMRLAGKPVGCGAFKRMAADAAYLKRMWISGEVRGLGLGRRLLGALEDRARLYGYRRACLETNKALVEAQSLYRRCGYKEVAPFNDEPYAHHWFEKPLT
ncbi:MAG: MarR family winged helix-turn-helix transcriptional regulator [Parvularculaceae bacterium]